MTTPTRDLPEPPERDPAFDAAWRAASSEGPPAALDRAILAAAHRAVDAGPRRAEVREATRWERWWFPLAAAATIGAVTIGILQLVPQEHSALPDGGATVSDVPAGAETKAGRADTAKRTAPPDAPVAASAPAASARPATAPAPGPRATEAPPTAERQAPADAARERARPREADAAKPQSNVAPPGFVPSPQPARSPSGPLQAPAAPAAPSPAPAFAPAPPPPAMPSEPAAAAESAAPRAAMRAPSAATERLAQPFPAETRDRQAASGGAGARLQPGGVGKLDAAPGASGRAESGGVQQAARPVDEWIALIRRLRQEGRIDEAAKELKAFRDAHRDAQALLPPDLRDWHPPAGP